LESRFFNLLINTPLAELNDDFVLQQVKEIESDAAYSKIKSRVFLKILDKMCSDDFLTKDEIVDPAEKAHVRIKKKLLQVKILTTKSALSKGDVFNHLLSEIVDEAKEYELYDSIVEALTNKKYVIANTLGYKEFLKIQHEIEYYQECSRARRLANDYYFVVISNQKLISHFSQKELSDFIDDKIQQMESDPYTTVSTGVQYFYKILKLAQVQRKGQWTDSTDICLELISLLKRSKAIGVKQRFGFVYGNMGESLIYQKRFKEAAQAMRVAQSYSPHNSFNYIISKEHEFYACFYGKDYVRCQEVLDVLLTHEKRDIGEIRYDKFTYYSGCLDFVLGRFKEAKRISNLALQILKDKPRWELGVRYLKIMSLIELGEFGEADDAIESLRKQIKRNSADEKTAVSERDEYIFRVLQEYKLCGYGKTASHRLIYFLKKLSVKDQPVSWKFYSHELFPVQRWLKKRITETVPATATASAAKSQRIDLN
ncbi:MAG: hypothetical protein IAF38_08270, partial [Bacteroidia bacterium]|nr:hypothetical protein [Bacteroidia bacterium]